MQVIKVAKLTDCVYADLEKLFAQKHDVLSGSDLLGALVILNGQSLERELLCLVWPRSKRSAGYPIICADGGANLLYETTKEALVQSESSDVKKQQEWIPTHIAGDLDSLRPEVRRWYETQGTRVVQDESVNSHDFQKSLDLAEQTRAEMELPTVVVGGHGGRMDQTLGNLNTLYSWAERDHAVYWLEKSNAILALSAGKHHIHIDASREGPSCGLIPIGKPVSSVSTEGLKWNLDEQELSFGKDGLVSTSNEILEPVVVVETSSPLLWTCELRLNLRST